MKVEIKPVDTKNWKQVLKLSLDDNQKDYLATNERYLAMCSVEKHLIPEVVLVEGVVAGFICYGSYLNNPSEFGITAFMLDKSFQGKGVGKKVLTVLLTKFKSLGKKEVYTSITPENKISMSFFESFGFKRTGELDFDELVYKLTL